MKRLTETNKWNTFLAGLPTEYKLLYLWLIDVCSNAGVWVVNETLANTFVGMPVDLDRALTLFAHRIHVFDEGRKWWIVSFPHFQEKGQLNSKHNRHAGMIEELKKYGLLKLITNKVSKSEKGADVYHISDELIIPNHDFNPHQDTYNHTYTNTYVDSYDHTIEVPVPVTVKVEETEKEPDEPVELNIPDEETKQKMVRWKSLSRGGLLAPVIQTALLFSRWDADLENDFKLSLPPDDRIDMVDVVAKVMKQLQNKTADMIIKAMEALDKDEWRVKNGHNSINFLLDLPHGKQAVQRIRQWSSQAGGGGSGKVKWFVDTRKGQKYCKKCKQPMKFYIKKRGDEVLGEWWMCPDCDKERLK